MRIRFSENYYHDQAVCPISWLDTCQRCYCPDHRLLYRECETSKLTRDGAGKKWLELGDCPDCDSAARRRDAAR